MRVIHLRALYLSNATTSGRDILDLVYQHHDHWNQIVKIEIGLIPPAGLFEFGLSCGEISLKNHMRVILRSVLSLDKGGTQKF